MNWSSPNVELQTPSPQCPQSPGQVTFSPSSQRLFPHSEWLVVVVLDVLEVWIVLVVVEVLLQSPQFPEFSSAAGSQMPLPHISIQSPCTPLVTWLIPQLN